MTVKLKNLDKSINRIRKKVVNMLTSGTVPNEISKQITADIKLKMSTGKMPDGKGGVKAAPALRPSTKRVYKAAGVRTKPRFEFSGKLKNAIQPKREGNTIKIQANTQLGKNKLKWLKSENTKSGTKKSRVVLEWTRVRTNIIRKIIREAIKRNFN